MYVEKVNELTLFNEVYLIGCSVSCSKINSNYGVFGSEVSLDLEIDSSWPRDLCS